jgi:hypothetical protein
LQATLYIREQSLYKILPFTQGVSKFLSERLSSIELIEKKTVAGKSFFSMFDGVDCLRDEVATKAGWWIVLRVTSELKCCCREFLLMSRTLCSLDAKSYFSSISW